MAVARAHRPDGSPGVTRWSCPGSFGSRAGRCGEVGGRSPRIHARWRRTHRSRGHIDPVPTKRKDRVAAPSRDAPESDAALLPTNWNQVDSGSSAVPGIDAPGPAWRTAIGQQTELGSVDEGAHAPLVVGI